MKMRIVPFHARMLRPALLCIMLCASAITATAAPLAVVTTTTDLAAIAREVGGDRVLVKSICASDQDPHFIDAKPSFMVLLRSADLFIKIGMQMEIGYEKSLIDGARNPKIRAGATGHLDASTLVRRLEIPAGVIDRSQGDVHAEGNPHYWLDPGNACRIARGMAARLAVLSPADTTAFNERAEMFARRISALTFGESALSKIGEAELWAAADQGRAHLDRLIAQHGAALGGWMALLAPARGKRVISYHRSFVYLFERFGLIQAGELEPKPGIPPSPRHLAQLIETARNAPVALVLIESFRADAGAKLVGNKIGAPVLALPQSAGGSATTTTYADFLDHLAREIARAIAGGEK